MEISSSLLITDRTISVKGMAPPHSCCHTIMSPKVRNNHLVFGEITKVKLKKWDIIEDDQNHEPKRSNT